MNEQKLNRKLAEWAGFIEANIKKYYYWGMDGIRLPKWVEPNTEYHIKLPRFTQSLDACFEWLVPKLRPETIKLVPLIGVEYITDYGKRWACVITPEGWREEVKIISANPHPALALCLVIEKLIDNE